MGPMVPVLMGRIYLQEEKAVAEQTVWPARNTSIGLVHKTIGGYGTSYYLTACGLYAGNYFVHVSDNEVTCPRCKSLQEPKG